MAKLPDGYIFFVESHRMSITLREKELVMCRNCCFYSAGENEVDAWSDCKLHSMHVSDNDWCSWGVKREAHDG